MFLLCSYMYSRTGSSGRSTVVQLRRSLAAELFAVCMWVAFGLLAVAEPAPRAPEECVVGHEAGGSIRRRRHDGDVEIALHSVSVDGLPVQSSYEWDSGNGSSVRWYSYKHKDVFEGKASGTESECDTHARIQWTWM